MKLVDKVLGLVENSKIKKGDEFNHDGATWQVIKVGDTSSRASALTKKIRGHIAVIDNKTILKSKKS